MTRQQMFNTAYHGLAAQGFTRSLSQIRGGGCAYRGDDNRRCALGYLIPDSVYNREWDKVGISGYGLAEQNITPEICAANKMFIDGLQNAHDLAITPSAMKIRLAEFAQKYGLTIPTLPDFTAAETPAPEAVTA